MHAFQYHEWIPRALRRDILIRNELGQSHEMN